MHIDFYYDIVCPYAYLASTQIDTIAARHGAEVRWHPVLLGGIFRSIGGPQVPMQAMSAPRARHNVLDLQRWADLFGCPLAFPTEHPRRTVETMRLLVATPAALRPALSKRLYRAYWVDGQDLADRDTLDAIARAFNIDPAVIDSDAAREGLFETTQAAVELGAFGVPAFGVNGHFYWGQDRLHFVEKALGAPREHNALPPLQPKQRLRFYHDFSSPFSYLASTQIERVAREMDAELIWCPILLGGLFRSIGTADVPLFEMSTPKRAYMAKDLRDWADWWGVPFRFPDHFPIRSITALRVSIVAPQLTPTLYRAAWADNRPIDDPTVLADLIESAGLDAADVLAATKTNIVKQQIRRLTQQAEDVGACGVPTFEIVGHEARESILIWGQDRLAMLTQALAGWRPQTAQ
ncbi:MAG: 2-hydroxychromene-2-carboxylate isomerase [Myxococcota bacterium]|nr:2-hydroxychromene-2-carboxylate isomerase [Myxococcota bacterium]